MKILLTGGNGFLGGHLARLLLKEGHQVTIIDKSGQQTGSFNNVNFYQLDVGDSKCARIFADGLFDYVIHLAEDGPDGQDSQAAAQVLQANQAGLANILSLSLKYHVKKLLYLSSYEVYGRPASLPLDENSPLQAKKLVGLGQQIQEMQCQEYRQLGLDVLVLRTGLIIGPHYGGGARASLQPLVDLAFGNQQAGVHYDLVYVSDVTQAILKSLPNKTSPVLLVASGQASTSKQIRQAFCTILADLYASQPTGSSVNYDPSSWLTSSCHILSRPDPAAQQAQPAALLSISRASQELDWQPHHDLASSLHKTLAWCYQAGNKEVDEETASQPDEKLPLLSRKLPRVADTILFGLLSLLLNYLLNYQLAIKVDLFLLYISLIALLYGLGQGLLALGWSFAARIFFLLVLDRQEAVMLTMSVDLVSQAALYILLGVSIGYASENRSARQESTRQELDSLKDELSFTNILYKKNLLIKNKLQAVIESNENSLGRLIHLFSRLEKADLESAYAEIASILADILKVGTVMIYSTDAPGNWFRLVAQAGETKYLASFQAGQYDFLPDLIKDRQIYVNSELREDYPLLCAPLYAGEMLEAVIFIDGIEFINLTQHFLNTLKSLIGLLSISIEQKYRLENKISSDKFIPDTAIVQKDWFYRIAQNLERQADSSVVLLKIKAKTDPGQASQLALTLIRPTDLIGELAAGQLGIIMLDLTQQELNRVQARFAKHGLALEPAVWKEEFAWSSSS